MKKRTAKKDPNHKAHPAKSRASQAAFELAESIDQAEASLWMLKRSPRITPLDAAWIEVARLAISAVGGPRNGR